MATELRAHELTQAHVGRLFEHQGPTCFGGCEEHHDHLSAGRITKIETVEAPMRYLEPTVRIEYQTQDWTRTETKVHCRFTDIVTIFEEVA